jgi:hypothetical protein
MKAEITPVYEMMESVGTFSGKNKSMISKKYVAIHD